ncbi:MAG TPA: dihydroorotate dehydrogenase (quinone), partial [Opitutus sp.]|nr:dihydroorotate dehydrogenase (quinone) [Opitutus sp.]
MGWFYRKIIRRGLFSLEAEHAHELAVDTLAVLAKFAPLRHVLARVNRLSPELAKPIEVFGLKFPNAVGLAAGFDKNASAWPAVEALGFGHVEIGTITALPQPGNERPRVFRYPNNEAVINRMG